MKKILSILLSVILFFTLSFIIYLFTFKILFKTNYFDRIIKENNVSEYINLSLGQKSTFVNNINASYQDLKKLGLNFEYKNDSSDDTLSGMTFVLTGTLEKYKREELTKILEDKGAKVTSSVTKKTTGVIVGDKPGSKYDKALKLGVKIYKEEDVENIIK